MKSLEIWANKIKEKWKNTKFSDFVKQIASWRPIVLAKNKWLISRYWNSDRIDFIDYKIFNQNRDELTNNWINYNFDINFFENIKELFSIVKLPNLLRFLENENADFADEVLGSQNVYLSSAVASCENVLYSIW